MKKIRLAATIRTTQVRRRTGRFDIRSVLKQTEGYKSLCEILDVTPRKGYR